ncbi:MAG TPA: hypothetical protein VGA36_00805, partial [Nitriliruptorales bacterium]
EYMSPEQASGNPLDTRTDVYSLGVVLYECLTGQPAFHGDTPTATAAARLHRELPPPRQIRADIPRPLDDVVVRATRRDREHRFPDGAALAASLAPLVRTRPSDVTAALVAPGGGQPRATADRGPSGRLGAPREQGRRLLIAIIGGLLLTLVAVLATEAVREDTGAQPPAVDGEAITIQDASDYDPRGDGEHPELVALAHDGDPSTAWRTERYQNDPRFGGLKDGVGMWFDLGAPTQVDSILIDLEHGGAGLSLYAANELPEQVDGLQGWGEPVVTERLEGTTTTLVFTDPSAATGRYWLLWLTELPLIDDTTYGAGLAEVRFIAP